LRAIFIPTFYVDDCEARIAGTVGNLSKETQGFEQGPINGGAFYLDGTSLEATTGFDDDPKGGVDPYLDNVFSCSNYTGFNLYDLGTNF
jgi:hypothetical protein